MLKFVQSLFGSPRPSLTFIPNNPSKKFYRLGEDVVGKVRIYFPTNTKSDNITLALEGETKIR